MNNEEFNPLLPKAAMVYFEDAENFELRQYLRAVGLRSCLENVINTIFIYLSQDENKVDEQAKIKWNKKRLVDKINSMNHYFSEEISDKLHRIRKLGNKGAHPNSHSSLSNNDLESCIEDLSKICEWTILACFIKYGFSTKPWIPTVFSTLPPIYRIRILENLHKEYIIRIEDKKEIINYLDYLHTMIFLGIEQPIDTIQNPKYIQIQQILLTIDKLAMAYLKNGDYSKSIKFIENCYNDNIVNSIFKDQMLDKLEMLHQDFDILPISKGLSDTRTKLKELLPAIKDEEKSLFLTLFTAILIEEAS